MSSVCRDGAARAALCMMVLMLPLGGCKRETRDLRTPPPVAAALDQVKTMPNGIGGAPPAIYAALDHTYETNAYQLSQGKQLYTQFNCKSCHADGGGASGPALTDGWWRYGPDVVSIFATIRDGRPRGMPAFGDKLTTDQIWQLTGYVRTMGSYTASTAYPSRDDSMQSRPSENRAPATVEHVSQPSH